MRRRALISGAAAIVVIAAVVVLVVALRGGGSEAASWPAPEPGETIAAPSVPSRLPAPAFPPEPTPSPTPKIVATPRPEPTTDATWDDLTELAEDEGTVPVIVTLRPQITAEGGLPQSRRAAQQERIEAAAMRLVEDLEGTAVANLERFDAVPLVTLDATPDALEELRASPEVVSVVEDVPLPLPRPVEASAPQATRTWGEADYWWHIGKSGIETAWNGGYDGRGQTVAVLDTGVQSDHPWLTGKVVAEACYSYGRNCPDDVDAARGAGSARPCTYAESCGHGTHVAHDAAGKYGVARGADIIAIQVFSRITGECQDWEGTVCTRSYISDQLKGLERVYELRDTHRIAAVNLSLGGGQFADYCDARDPIYSSWIKTLVSYGIAVVIATGNESLVDGIGEPACYRDAIPAGASTLDTSGAEAVATFSNRAPRLFNLLAPGEFICSAWMNGAASCGNGTSYASPLIAGTFATLRQLNPQASVTAMRDSIVCSGVTVADGSQVRRIRLDVWRAVNAMKDGC
jgi:subtilisin family serine protease